jgi:hypothetical protein
MKPTTRRRFLLFLAGVLPLRAVFGKTPDTLHLADFERVEAGPGELIHILHGNRHGFDQLSLIFAESAPGGGPPLHTHDCEEVHLVEAGTVAYFIDGERFTRTGPFVQRIPAAVPHAFINAGDRPLKITGIFPSRDYTFRFRGPSPLWKPGA